MEDEVLTIEERVQRMEDLEEIRNLLIAYAHHLDHADASAYAQLFALDGQLDLGPAGQASGRASIQELLEKVVQRRTAVVRHIVSSPVIGLDGNRATARFLWTMLRCAPGESPMIGMVGHHEDIVVKEDGVWKFLRVQGHVDVGLWPQAPQQ